MRLYAALFFCLMSLAPVAQPASRNSEVTRALTQEYATYVKAFSNKNIDPIANQLLPGWSGRIGGETMGRSQVLAMTREAMQSTRAVQDMCIRIQRVSVKGNVATATVTDNATLEVWNADGETYRTVTSSNLRRDTWVRTASGWKMRRSDVLRTLR
jgi:hypothetical protein